MRNVTITYDYEGSIHEEVVEIQSRVLELVSFTVKEGYKIVGVKVNGEDVAVSGKYLFEYVTEDQIIEITLEETIAFVGISIDYAAATHQVGIHIYGINRIGNENNVILGEKIQNVADVALGAIADKDFTGAYVDAAIGVIGSDLFGEELITFIGAVTLKTLGSSHFIGCVGHGIGNALGKGSGYVANAQTDNRSVGVVGNKFRCATGNLGKEISFGHFGKVFVDFQH